MVSPEHDQSIQRKSALLVGQIAGFLAGLVVALILGTDSRITAFSGMVLGAAAGIWIQNQYPFWIRLGVALFSVLSITYVWWPD